MSYEADDEKRPLMPRNVDTKRFPGPPSTTMMSSVSSTYGALSTINSSQVIVQEQPRLKPITSIYKSAEYAVIRDPIDIDLSKYFYLKVFSITKYIVIPFFVSVICVVIALYSLWSANIITELQSILLICAVTIVVSCVSAFGVYYFGTIESAIDDFKDQNHKFRVEINDLSEQKNKLKQEYTALHFTTSRLKICAKGLEKDMEQYNDLIESLMSTAKDNQELNEIVNGYLNAIDDMEDVICRHEEADLWIMFYETVRKTVRDEKAPNDGDNNNNNNYILIDSVHNRQVMREKEFNDLLHRMNERTRKRTMDLGGFQFLDKDNDGEISVMEFQRLVDALVHTNETEISFLKQKTQMIRRKSRM